MLDDDMGAMVSRLLKLAALAAAVSALLPALAHAGGGDYAFEGGTPRQQAQVRGALEASTFDWNLVPQRVTVHIGDYGTSSSTPGHVWLDGRLLDAGTFSWATILDEWAHQLDFLVLDDARRALLAERLGVRVWCRGGEPALHHGAYGCERFASMVAWAFWPSRHNAYQPTSRTAESASMPAAEFRYLLASVLGAPRLAFARLAPPKASRTTRR